MTFDEALSAMRAGHVVSRGNGIVMLADYGRRYVDGNGNIVEFTVPDKEAKNWFIIKEKDPLTGKMYDRDIADYEDNGE